MKWLLISLVLLASCTKEQPAGVVTPAAPDAEITLASAAVKTVKTATAAQEPDEPDEPEPEEPDEPIAGACAVKIPWSVLARCTHDGFVYAVGASEGVREVALARQQAALRATAAVLKKDGVVSGVEIVEIGRCGKVMHALARAPAKNVSAEKRACEAAKLKEHAAPLPGCPAWTITGVRREGDTVVAVGVARMKNTALAESTAINRARAELRKLSSVRVGKNEETGHTHSHSAGESSFSELGRKKVACAGNTFMELTAKAID